MKCLDTLKSREKNFQEFDKCIDSEFTDKWKEIDARPQKKNKEVLSVHVAKFKHGGFYVATYLSPLDLTLSQVHQRKNPLTRHCCKVKLKAISREWADLAKPNLLTMGLELNQISMS